MSLKEHFFIELNKQDSVYYIKGSFGIHVPCGSQLAYWSGFPLAITFTLTTSKGDIIQSIEGLSSVSHDHSTIEYYAGLPCNQVVVQNFFEPLAAFFWEALPHDLLGAKISGEYLGLQSNVLIV